MQKVKKTKIAANKKFADVKNYYPAQIGIDGAAQEKQRLQAGVEHAGQRLRFADGVLTLEKAKD